MALREEQFVGGMEDRPEKSVSKRALWIKYNFRPQPTKTSSEGQKAGKT